MLLSARCLHPSGFIRRLFCYWWVQYRSRNKLTVKAAGLRKVDWWAPRHRVKGGLANLCASWGKTGYGLLGRGVCPEAERDQMIDKPGSYQPGWTYISSR